MFIVTSTSIYTQYKAQTMCKTRFGSQGVILDGFLKKFEEKNLNGTRDTPPSMAKVMKNDQFLYPFPYQH